MDNPALYALLLAALPIIGKALLMVPFVYNKLIPFLLLALNVVAKYWLILGWPTEIQPQPISGETMLSGIFAWSIPWTRLGIVVWAAVEQYLVHRFYEGKRADAAIHGTVSWWERGKRDMWQD